MWYRPMVARRPDEEHRAATPLELFFDLCFVVAIAFAASELHHDIAEGHVGHAVLGYLTVFFAIWWAWMNFTWFASAYDTDDGLYRATTLVQVAGVLVLAAGVPRAFDGDFAIPTYGYVLMRLALVSQWLRAARSDPPGRGTALRYAAGVTAVQVCWLLRLLLPESWLLPSFLVLMVAELLVPVWAERAAPTGWHPEHIAERYGLFTIIMLGESVLAASVAIQTTRGDASLLSLAGAGLVIVFSMWWLYFDRPGEGLVTSLRQAIAWGYGHYVVFASAAAVGAGLSVAVDQQMHETHISDRVAGYATAVPVAGYLLGVWALHVWRSQHGLVSVAFPVTAALVLLAPLAPASVPVIAVLMAALVVTTVVATHRQPAHRTAE